MNNKGFTLIEIIAVIGLLALVATMVGSSLISMNQKQNQKNYDNYKETIANAGCLYFEGKKNKMYSSYADAVTDNPERKVERSYCIDSRHTCYISVGTLIDNGFIAEDMIDPTTQVRVKRDEVAVVQYSKGRKTCCYESCLPE